MNSTAPRLRQHAESPVFMRVRAPRPLSSPQQLRKFEGRRLCVNSIDERRGRAGGSGTRVDASLYIPNILQCVISSVFFVGCEGYFFVWICLLGFFFERLPVFFQ